MKWKAILIIVAKVMKYWGDETLLNIFYVILKSISPGQQKDY